MPLEVYDSEFWNKKYLRNEHRWDIGKPTPIFVDQEKSFKNNSQIIIPGCGLGHDALYFAKKKHIVYAVDFSQFAIDHINKISQKSNVKINTINDDFFNLNNSYNNKYDYVVEYTFFCAINPNKRYAYAKKCHDLLKNGGVLKGLFLPLNSNSASNPPFHVTIEQIKNIFENLFHISEINYNINSISKRVNNEVFIEMIKK